MQLKTSVQTQPCIPKWMYPFNSEQNTALYTICFFKTVLPTSNVCTHCSISWLCRFLYERSSQAYFINLESCFETGRLENCKGDRWIFNRRVFRMSKNSHFIKQSQLWKSAFLKKINLSNIYFNCNVQNRLCSFLFATISVWFCSLFENVFCWGVNSLCSYSNSKRLIKYMFYCLYFQ